MFLLCIVLLSLRHRCTQHERRLIATAPFASTTLVTCDQHKHTRTMHDSDAHARTRLMIMSLHKYHLHHTHVYAQDTMQLIFYIYSHWQSRKLHLPSHFDEARHLCPVHICNQHAHRQGEIRICYSTCRLGNRKLYILP